MSDGFRERFLRAATRVTRGALREVEKPAGPTEAEERAIALSLWLSLPAARNAFLPIIEERIAALETAQEASFKDHANMLIHQGALNEARRFKKLVERHNAGHASGPRTGV